MTGHFSYRKKAINQQNSNPIIYTLYKQLCGKPKRNLFLAVNEANTELIDCFEPRSKNDEGIQLCCF